MAKMRDGSGAHQSDSSGSNFLRPIISLNHEVASALTFLRVADDGDLVIRHEQVVRPY
jgi:hypothetical protein